jgi:hypothetical protein
MASRIPENKPKGKTGFKFEDRGPYSINGFGTRYYGKRDFDPDGSYITTEWIVFAFLPIVPFRSLRVSYLGEAEGKTYLFGFGTTHNYSIHEKRFPPNWKQVFSTYAFLSVMGFWIYLVFSKTKSSFLETPWGAFIICAICLIPAPLPLALRYFSNSKK